jgi:alpha-tubulin suppressor-like RCC1 family protein
MGNQGFFKLNVVSDKAAGNGDVFPQISVGEFHSVALKSDGTVWSWGYNNVGQLGVKGTRQSLVPIQVMYLDDTGSPKALSDIVKISAGGNHTLALAKDGTVWAWGSNVKKELGLGSAKDSSSYENYAVKVKSSDGVNDFGSDSDGYAAPIVDIAASGYVSSGNYGVTRAYSFAIDAEGRLFGWGTNYSGLIDPQGSSVAFNKNSNLPRNLTDSNSILSNAFMLAPEHPHPAA